MAGQAAERCPCLHTMAKNPVYGPTASKTWFCPLQWLSPWPPVNWTWSGTWSHTTRPIVSLVIYNISWPRKMWGRNQISIFEGMQGETQWARGNQQWPRARQSSGEAEAICKQGKLTVRETLCGLKNGEGVQSLKLLWTHFSSSRSSSGHVSLNIKTSPFLLQGAGGVGISIPWIHRDLNWTGTHHRVTHCTGRRVLS